MHRAPAVDALLPVGWLRDYQKDLALRIAAAMALGYRRILVVLPTGGGKTRLAAALMACAREQRDRSQFVVHRKELIDQTSDAFTELNLPHGFIASGRPFASEDDLITLSGIQTLVRRLDMVLPQRLAILDEGHHCVSTSWTTLLDHYAEQDCFVVALTATPERLDGKGMEEHFDLMIVGPSTADLIDAGWLSPYDYYAPGVPDLSGVHTTAGDFNRGEIDELMNEPQLVGDIVSHYQKLAPNQQGIVFAASVKHSKNIVDAFRAAGVTAEHIDGAMADAERKRVVTDHREGRVQILCNVEIVGEGFDVPAVSYVGLARPTKSLGLHLQQVGRGLRIAPGKERATICDHAGNAFRHGLPDDPREWSLEGRKGRSGGSAPNDATSVHQCETCFRVVPSAVKVCPGCETAFPVRAVAPPKEVAGELAKLERLKRAEEKKREREEREAAKKAERIRHKIEERQATTFQDFLRLAIARGYPKPQGWAGLKMSLKSGGSRR